MRFFIPPDHDIKHMPSDARVEFIYMPTYTLAAYLIHCKMILKEQFTNDEEPEEGFKGILLASTGRNMTGHGYEELDGLVDALEIFLEAPLKAFLDKYGSHSRNASKAPSRRSTLSPAAKPTPPGANPKNSSKEPKLL